MQLHNHVDDIFTKKSEPKENSEEKFDTSSIPHKGSLAGANRNIHQTANKSSAKTTSYQANCLVIGHQGKIFGDLEYSEGSQQDELNA